MMIWARLCEMAIGLWVASSPWVLPRGSGPGWVAINETVCGAACVLIAVVSCMRPRQWWNLLQIPVAAWLVGVAYATSTSPATATAQSDLLAAFFLVNFAIIPTRATAPPDGWTEAMTHSV